MTKIEVISPSLASTLCHNITANLSEYFGLDEANARYAFGVRSCINLAAYTDETYVGLMAIDFPYPENANIYWMGILRSYQAKGIGKTLAKEAFKQVQDRGAKTISVETVSPKEADANYLKTYRFYQSLGFTPLFNLQPEGYECTMVYMLKTL